MDLSQEVFPVDRLQATYGEKARLFAYHICIGSPGLNCKVLECPLAVAEIMQPQNGIGGALAPGLLQEAAFILSARAMIIWQNSKFDNLDNFAGTKFFSSVSVKVTT